MKHIIKIKGMHCKSCEMLIKDSLEEINGVESAELSHTAGTATVIFDENKVNIDDLKKIIKNEGYEVI